MAMENGHDKNSLTVEMLRDNLIQTSSSIHRRMRPMPRKKLYFLRKEVCWASLFTVLEARFRADLNSKALSSMISKGTESPPLPLGHLVLLERFRGKVKRGRRGASHLSPKSATAPYTDVCSCRHNTSWTHCNLYRAGTEVRGRKGRKEKNLGNSRVS